MGQPLCCRWLMRHSTCWSAEPVWSSCTQKSRRGTQNRSNYSFLWDKGHLILWVAGLRVAHTRMDVMIICTVCVCYGCMLQHVTQHLRVERCISLVLPAELPPCVYTALLISHCCRFFWYIHVYACSLSLQLGGIFTCTYVLA